MTTQTDTTLATIGHSYLAFLNSAGNATDDSFVKQVPNLFARTCKKVVNGTTKFETNEAFGPYMRFAQENYGKWKIQPDYQVFPSLSTHSITLKFVAETTKIQLLVIAILKIDSTDLITEIFEVDTLLETKSSA